MVKAANSGYIKVRWFIFFILKIIWKNRYFLFTLFFKVLFIWTVTSKA